MEDLLVEPGLGLGVGCARETEFFVGAEEVGDLGGGGEAGEEVAEDAAVFDLEIRIFFKYLMSVRREGR